MCMVLFISDSEGFGSWGQKKCGNSLKIQRSDKRSPPHPPHQSRYQTSSFIIYRWITWSDGMLWKMKKANIQGFKCISYISPAHVRRADRTHKRSYAVYTVLMSLLSLLMMCWQLLLLCGLLTLARDFDNSFLKKSNIIWSLPHFG